MQTALTGVIPLRGDLRIAIRDASSNEIRWRYEIRNTITYVALKGLVNLISQTGTGTIGSPTTPGTLESLVAAYRVSYLRLGTGTLAPTRSDINLGSPAPSAAAPHTIELNDAQKFLTTSNPFEMKIVATLATGDLNGYALTEAGLFFRGKSTPTIPAPPTSPAIYAAEPLYYPELFARQIHPVINKTAAFVVDYDWRISFTS
jgi:hypothetical protein